MNRLSEVSADTKFLKLLAAETGRASKCFYWLQRAEGRSRK